jgi:hypothetical protein
MKNLSFVLGSLLLLVSGCDNSVKGQLQVRTPFNMIDRKGNSFAVTSSRELTVDPENVGEGPGKESVKLKLEDDNGKDRKVELKVPANQSIPENGTLMIRGAELNQEFDLLTDVATHREDGPQEQDYENCTYQRQVYVCHHTPQGQQCGYEWVNVQGYCRIVRHLHTLDVQAESTFLVAGTSQVLATFAGERHESYYVTDWTGDCR